MFFRRNFSSRLNFMSSSWVRRGFGFEDAFDWIDSNLDQECTQHFSLINIVVEEGRPLVQTRPCDVHPCGSNAMCSNTPTGGAKCTCPPDYVGDPYASCRPQCVINSDCPRSRSCVNNRCISPCSGACGVDSECRVANHRPVCTCREGFTGDPYNLCRPIPVISKPVEQIATTFLAALLASIVPPPLALVIFLVQQTNLTVSELDAIPTLMPRLTSFLSMRRKQGNSVQLFFFFRCERFRSVVYRFILLWSFKSPRQGSQSYPSSAIRYRAV